VETLNNINIERHHPFEKDSTMALLWPRRPPYSSKGTFVAMTVSPKGLPSIDTPFEGTYDLMPFCGKIKKILSSKVV
jgi:hypothetical protein